MKIKRKFKRMYWYYRQGPTATVCATRLTLGSKDYTYTPFRSHYSIHPILTLLTDYFLSIDDHYSVLYFHIYNTYSDIYIHIHP